MASSSSGAAPVSVATTGPPVRVLTASETTLINRVAASQGIPKSDLLPNDAFITTTPYDSRWYNAFFKAFIDSDGVMNENLAMIGRFESLLAADPSIPDIEKKKVSVQNRKRELLIKAYYQNPRAELKVDKVVCCIIRKDDNFGLFVKNNDLQLGYPKGDVEYFLTDPTNILTVYREPLTRGALRELEEETGFRITSGNFTPVPMNLTLSYNSDTLNIINAKVEFNEVLGSQAFYLILYTDTVMPLTDLTLPSTATSENIIEKLWHKQFNSLSNERSLFNVYSTKPQRYMTMAPPSNRQKASTYFGGAKKKYRKLMTRRRFTQKKRKSKAKTRVIRRKH